MRHALAACLLPLAALAADWVAVDCPPPRELLAEGLVAAGPLAGGIPGADWGVAGGEQNAAATATPVAAGPEGGPALEVAWTFAGRPGLEYVEVRPPPIACAAREAVIAVRLRCEDAELTPRARFTDPGGETFQYDIAWERGPGWRTGYIDLAGKPAHWGGDGAIQLPLTLTALVFDRPEAGFAGSGRLWLGGLAAMARQEPAALAIAQPAPRLGHLFNAGETLRLRGTSPGGSVAWELHDGHGASLGSGGGGAVAEVAVALPRRVGHYTCRFTATAPGRAPARRDYLCAILDEAPPPPQAWAGFSVHWCSGWDPAGIALLPRYAVATVRDEIAWSGVERSRGVYALPARGRAALDAYAAAGVRPLLILDYANPLYDDGAFPDGEAARAGFAAYAGWMARDVGREVLAFEVWNEWVGGCGMAGRAGDHSPAAYGPLCAAAHAAVKAVDPRLPVVAIGGEYGGAMAANVAAMVDAGATGDGFSVHPYCYPRSPEAGDVAGMVTGVRTVLRQRGRPEQVWASEVGWPTHRGNRGIALEEQARYTARTLALLWGAGTARVYWYDFQDDGLDPGDNENNFGLVLNARREWAPKPAIVAFAAFNRRTAGATAPRLVRQGEAWLACARLADGRDLVVAWAERDGVGWKPAAAVAQAWDLFGAPLAQVPETLGPAAVYLVGSGIAP